MFGLSAPFSGEGSPDFWILDKSVDESGFFFVYKKTGTLILIFVARDTNMRFHSPPSVSLVTSERFSMIERCLSCSSLA